MSKYKEGDKIVLEIISGEAYGDYLAGSKEQNWWFNAEGLERGSEPLGTYTEPLKRKNENKQKQIEKLVDKLHRQAAEITRLLASNAEIQGLNNTICDVCKSDEFLKETAESAKKEGQNEAWELAKKCMLMTDRERETIFGSGHNALYGVLTYFDYKHAAAKVAEWEKAKEEIEVGDVVESNNGNGERIAVIDAWPSFDGLHFEGISSNGTLTIDASAKYYTKTGRHIDIGSFLKQIGEEQE